MNYLNLGPFCLGNLFPFTTTKQFPPPQYHAAHHCTLPGFTSLIVSNAKSVRKGPPKPLLSSQLSPLFIYPNTIVRAKIFYIIIQFHSSCVPPCPDLMFPYFVHRSLCNVSFYVEYSECSSLVYVSEPYREV